MYWLGKVPDGYSNLLKIIKKSAASLPDKELIEIMDND